MMTHPFVYSANSALYKFINYHLGGIIMSVLTDLIYGGSNAVAGLTEGAVNDAIAKYGADKEIAFPDTAYFFPTIYAATGVKVKTLGDLPACVGVLKSLITNQ